MNGSELFHDRMTAGVRQMTGKAIIERMKMLL
jgi:hypothetical protein